LKHRTRKINNETIAQFKHLLENEMWECLKKKDTNYKFNSFLCIFLYTFDASFPVQNKSVGTIKNGWITQEIKISCKHKRSLCIHIYIAGAVLIHK
jgi:hypothetical protein